MSYTNIFVYGTLMIGFYNHKLLSFSTFLGTSKTAMKFTMYNSVWPV